MKKTFRFACLFMALLLCLTAVACNGTVATSDPSSAATTTTTTGKPSAPDPAALYEQAELLFDEQANWKELLTMTMKFEINGTTLEFKANGDIFKRGSGDALQYSSVTTVNLFGNEIVSNEYFKDGFYYTQSNGEYSAREMTAAQFMDEHGGDSELDIQFADFKDVVLTESDGKYTMTATLTGDSAAVFNEMFESMEAMVVVESIPMEMVFTADGLPQSLSLEVTANGVIEEQATVVTATAEVKYSYPTDAVSIAWPDLNFYKEGYAVTDRRLAIVAEVEEKLLDADGNLVTNWENLYDILCTRYGEFDIAWALDYIALGGATMSRDEYLVVYMTRYTLWDTDGNPVSDIDAQYQALCDKYGQAAVDAAVAYITGS